MEDETILDLYFAREERAIAETGKKYGGYCRSIAFNILRSHEDTEECVSDTWLHTWNAIPPARPGCLRAFVGRITRNLSFTRWEAARAQKRGGGQTEILLSELADCLPGGERVDARLDAQSRGWVTGRMAKTDLAVLRLAVGEMLFMDNVPNGVSINEAVNLAKKYGEAQSPKFINAVLSKINRSIEEEV